MKIDKYRSIAKGSLVAYFDLIIPQWGNLRIRGMSLFHKDGKRWISFPTQMVEENGQKKYYAHLYFEDKGLMQEFSKKVIKAIDDDALEKSKQKVEQKEQQYQQEEIPF